jgi:chemotaxis protein methyltransferase CheR
MTATRRGFDDLIRWAGARTGLAFTPDRVAGVESAIRRAMARAGMDDDLPRYRRLVEVDDGARHDLLAELTVGETYFFREPAQFQFIRDTVLPEIRHRRGADQSLHAWSAGCASGEEAYSLAIVLLEEGLAGRCSLLATDLSRAMLEKARRATYGEWSLRGHGAEAARPHLRGEGHRFVVAEGVRRLVTFDYLNLASETDPASATGAWGMDLILCRNVLIYFNRETVRSVARRLHDALAEGGWLITASTDPPLAGLVPLDVVLTDHGVFYRRMTRGRRHAGPDPGRAAEIAASGARGPEPGAGPASAPGARTEIGSPAPDSRAGGRPAAVPAPQANHREGRGPDRGDDVADVALRIRSLANQDAEEAERRCAEATERHPLASELHYLRAVLLLGLGRDREAAQAVRRAIYLDRSLAMAHFTLGSILRRLGDDEGAWRSYRNARDLGRAVAAEDIVPLSDGEPAGRLAAAAESQMAQLEAARRIRP